MRSWTQGTDLRRRHRHRDCGACFVQHRYGPRHCGKRVMLSLRSSSSHQDACVRRPRGALSARPGELSHLPVLDEHMPARRGARRCAVAACPGGQNARCVHAHRDVAVERPRPDVHEPGASTPRCSGRIGGHCRRRSFDLGERHPRRWGDVRRPDEPLHPNMAGCCRRCRGAPVQAGPAPAGRAEPDACGSRKRRLPLHTHWERSVASPVSS